MSMQSGIKAGSVPSIDRAAKRKTAWHGWRLTCRNSAAHEMHAARRDANPFVFPRSPQAGRRAGCMRPSVMRRANGAFWRYEQYLDSMQRPCSTCKSPVISTSSMPTLRCVGLLESCGCNNVRRQYRRGSWGIFGWRGAPMLVFLSKNHIAGPIVSTGASSNQPLDRPS